MNEDVQYLSPIRGVASVSGFKRGYFQAEGDVEMEVTADLLPYFLYAARMTPTKTGVGPYTYDFVPADVVLPTTGVGASARKTLSIYVDRAEQPFAYTGMSVGSTSFSIDNGNLIVTFSLLGLDVRTAADGITRPSPTFPTTWAPYGPGLVGIELPSGTPRVDIDTFSFDIDDGAESLNRVKMGGRGPSYIRWGEREVSGSFDHDFLDMTEYNAFINKTNRVFKIIGERNAANDSVTITANSFFTDTYPITLGGIGDLVRASVDFRAIHYNGTAPYSISVKTTENIT